MSGKCTIHESHRCDEVPSSPMSLLLMQKFGASIPKLYLLKNKGTNYLMWIIKFGNFGFIFGITNLTLRSRGQKYKINDLKWGRWVL